MGLPFVSTSREDPGTASPLLDPSRLVPLAAFDEQRRTVMLCCEPGLLRKSTLIPFTVGWFFDVSAPVNNVQGRVFFQKVYPANTWNVYWHLFRVGVNGAASARIRVGTFQTGPAIYTSPLISANPGSTPDGSDLGVTIPNTSPRDVWFNNLDAALTTNGGTLPLW